MTTTKELVVISGKGGTGKTSITGSLAALSQKTVTVDCDVDASDLHLLLKPQNYETNDFIAGVEPIINKDLCVNCGKCIEVCEFDSISDDIEIDYLKCESCGVCAYFCPANAIELKDKNCGKWFKADTRFGKFIHAKLAIGEENSGKLVSLIRNQARLLAKQEKAELIITDGSPGVGCPVIASISGANLVLIVTEPTMSGLHDLERVFKLTQHFKIPSCVCVNKFDINPDMTKQIEEFAKENNIEHIANVPYDKGFTSSQIEGKTIVETHSKTKEVIINMYNKIMEKL